MRTNWRGPYKYRKALEKCAGFILLGRLDAEMGLDMNKNRQRAKKAMAEIGTDWDDKYITEMLAVALEQ